MPAGPNAQPGNKLAAIESEDDHPSGQARAEHQPGESRYSLYLETDLNRVFTGSLLEVAAAELRLVADGLDSGRPETSELGVGDIERIGEGRSQLLQFSASGPETAIAAMVGQLSASSALFRHESSLPVSSGSGALLPIPIVEPLMYSSELVTVQRYRGKTNERLTRAMLNIALATAGIDVVHPIGTVLDPMCGRGTTVNWALAYGLNAVGIEQDTGSLDQHSGFLPTWAKRNRLPHKVQRFKQNNPDKRHLELEVGPDRATFKAGDGQRIQTFCADAADRSLAIKRGSIDAIVTDLPYGVQHAAGKPLTGKPGSGNPGSGKSGADASTQGSETVELLQRVLPVWHGWLRSKGAICLAWNAKRGGRREIGRALADAGFTPVTAAGGFSMRHVVDASIDRDVIVARRLNRSGPD